MNLFDDDPKAVELLAESLTPIAPSTSVKDRLFAAINSAHEPKFNAIRVDEGRWKPTEVPGVSWKRLFIDKQSGLITMLVRMEPGTVYPIHRHERPEQCLILEGDVIQGDKVYHPGDFTWTEGNATVPTFRTEKGNLLLIVSGLEKEAFL